MKTNYAVGHQAEQLAADYLKQRGFKIKDINWNTRFCEIDIVAEKEGTIYFVEVKARKNSKQGTGLDYITNKKLKQMSYAAEFWVNSNGWEGPYQLAVVSIDAGELVFIDNVV